VAERPQRSNFPLAGICSIRQPHALSHRAARPNSSIGIDRLTRLITLGRALRDDESSERTSRSKRVDWVERWRDVIADEPELPGVWRRQGGGFHVRGRTIDPRSGKMREINWALPNLSKARDAFAWLQAELEKIRSGVVAEQPSLARSSGCQRCEGQGE
jgi:hypothetical protein